MGMWKRHHLPLLASSDLSITKTTDPVGSLWVSVSKAADKVNTKEINVSVFWATLSFVNTHNRFSAFFPNTPTWPCRKCWTKCAQGQQVQWGSDRATSATQVCSHTSVYCPEGKEAEERVRELFKYAAYIRSSWDLRNLTFLNLSLFKEHCVLPLAHQLVHGFVGL